MPQSLELVAHFRVQASQLRKRQQRLRLMPRSHTPKLGNLSQKSYQRARQPRKTTVVLLKQSHHLRISSHSNLLEKTLKVKTALQSAIKVMYQIAHHGMINKRWMRSMDLLLMVQTKGINSSIKA